MPSDEEAPPNVWLNVYHITPLLNECLFACYPSARIYHSGLQVYSSEYSYGGGEYPARTGIMRGKPRTAEGCTFHESIPLGRIAMDPLEVMAEVRGMATDWTQGAYDPFEHNCNCFSAALALRLLGESRVPPYVNAFGTSCSCLYRCVLAATLGEVVTYPEAPDDNFPLIANMEKIDSALLDATLVQKQQGTTLFEP